MRYRHKVLTILVSLVAIQATDQTAFCQSATPEDKLNVRDFGCIGDDKHDDTSCFQSVTKYIASNVRQNRTPGSDGNRLSNNQILIPAGTYLITEPDSLMPASGGARTAGFRITGSGDGLSVIDFRPKRSGSLLGNNDSWFGVSITGITFVSNDPNSDFIDSTSHGGAQWYKIQDASFTGKWRSIVRLQGTNSNSEWEFGHDTFSGEIESVIDIPQDNTSDQFLNYWFHNCRIDITHGNFIQANRGGHFTITDCDFSGLEGSGNPAAPNVLFRLKGQVHASGVTYFICRNSRFELKTDSIKVLDSEWGNYGEVSFEDDDFSSQSGSVAPTPEFVIRLNHAAGAAQYNFLRSHLMGSVDIEYSSSDTGLRQNVTFEDVQFVSYEDFASAIKLSNVVGLSGPFGSEPQVECVRCRGTDNQIDYSGDCKRGQRIAGGTIVSCGGYRYRALMGGTTADKELKGRAKALQDGNVQWTTLDQYPGSEYVQNATIRTSGFPESGNNGNPHTVVIAIRTNGSKRSRVILPPYSLVTEIQVIASKNSKKSSKVVLRNDDYSERILAVLTSDGDLITNSGKSGDQIRVQYETLNEIGSRSLVLEQETEKSLADQNVAVIIHYL